jgi:hypothetical protein
MANDFFYNFSDKSNIEDESLKLNLDELYVKKQEQNINIMNNYNKILVRIHNKIKYVSKNLVNEQCCWYIVPEIVLGIPKYNHSDCTVYVIEKLRENGFVVRYTHPNLLFISWKHWVPSYVRSEIKKKTGNSVDEYGNIIDKNSSNNDSLFPNSNSNSNSSNSNNYNDMIFNTDNSTKKIVKKPEYKDVKTYKPSGNLIYNNNLLEKLSLND